MHKGVYNVSFFTYKFSWHIFCFGLFSEYHFTNMTAKISQNVIVPHFLDKSMVPECTQQHQVLSQNNFSCISIHQILNIQQRFKKETRDDPI